MRSRSQDCHVAPRLALVLMLVLVVLCSTLAVPFAPRVVDSTFVPMTSRHNEAEAGRYITSADIARLNQSPHALLSSEHAAERAQGPLLSLRSACAPDLAQHCSTTGSLRCLLNKWESLPAMQRAPPHITETCAAWLIARDACFAALQHVGSVLCRDAAHGRECLRRMPRTLLPNQCVNSDYFRSVLLMEVVPYQRS